MSSPDGRAGIHLTARRRNEWLDANADAAEVSLSVFTDSSLTLTSTDTHNFDGIGLDSSAKAVAKKVVNDLYRGLFLSNRLPVNDDVNLLAMAVESCADNLAAWLLDPL